MAAKKQIFANKLLDTVLRNVAYSGTATVFVGLHTVTPDWTTGGVEVSTTGTGYVRQPVTFAAAALASTSNSAAVTFPVATSSWGTINGVSITNTATFTAGGGDQLYFGNLGTPKAVSSGDQLNFAIGALVVTES